MTRARAVTVLTGALVWLVTAVAAWFVLFTHHHRDMVLGGHDVVVTPTFDGKAVLRMGPYLPDIRIPTHNTVGVSIVVNKTTTDSTQSLVARYALMASHPQPEIRRVTEELRSMALDDAVRAAVIGLLPLGGWLLVGAERRRQLRHVPRRTAVSTGVVLVLAAVIVWEPWQQGPEQADKAQWISLQTALPGVTVPSELDAVRLEGGLFTNETEFLAKSAIRVFAQAKVYYGDLAKKVTAVADQIRQPAPGDTVGLLISDRHDNIGMDQVALAIAQAGKATAIVDAGDETSSGASWESFSLESLDDTFHGYRDRVFVAGNHDHGGFVDSYLEKVGWTHLDGSVQTPFGGIRMLGVDDPRANGLVDPLNTDPGNFLKVTEDLSNKICDYAAKGERIATVVVHDATMALPALTRGCTDLVLAGHLHMQVGPDRIVGTNGHIGYRYTNGTTGGAAFSFALGPSLKHDAEATLVTWRGGRPIGIQPIAISAGAQVTVKPYVALDLTSTSPVRQPPELPGTR